jgi:putative peptide zinc metalloprotease protein
VAQQLQLSAPPGPPPSLSVGAELLGTYEDSGFREPRYLVRRADGQVVQLSRLLYLVASCLDMGADVEQISRYVSERLGRDVSAENVTYLIDRKLRPTGIVSAPGSNGPATRANPLLALRLRLPVIPERVHGKVTGALLPLFRTPVVLGVVAALLSLDAWLLLAGRESAATATQQVIYRPGLVLAMTALVVVMGAFHETGHATAARYGGAKPGAMGAGIYLVWPVFYTDVTDAYRLDRRGRLRTDLGGIYFNLVFTLVAAAVYGVTGEGLFLAMVLLTQVETLRQFLPFVRLDGYYIVADLAGVPNLFPYLRPALTTAVRFRRGVPRHAAWTRKLRALTRRSQTVLTIWAGVTFPILLVNVVAFVVLAPRLAGTAWASADLQARVVSAAVDQSDLIALLNGVVGLAMLALPIAGVLYIVARVAGKIPAIVGTAWRRSAMATGATTTVLGGLLVFQVGFVWPDTFASAANTGGPDAAGDVESAAAQASAERAGADVGSGWVLGLSDEPRPAVPAVPVPPLPGPAPGSTAPGADTTAPDPSTTAPEPSTTEPGAGTTAPDPSTTVPGPSTTEPETTTTAPSSSTTAPSTTTTSQPGITLPIPIFPGGDS